MEPASKILEQIAFNTRPKFHEILLKVMDKGTHEGHLSQPLQTKKKKQFKMAVTFLTGYIGIFNVTNSKKRFLFRKSKADGDDLFKSVYHMVRVKLAVKIMKIRGL